MKSSLITLGFSVGVCLIAGCSSPQPAAPSKPAKPAAAAVAPATKPQPQPEVQPAAPVAPPVLSAEVKEVVEQLTQPEVGGLQHEKVEATGFPQAMASLQAGAAAPAVDNPVNYSSQPPTRGLTADGAAAELVERDWTGIVLVPVNTEFSKLYTSLVKFTSIEAHPLTDGRVRIWTRVRNVTQVPVQVGVACTFKMQERDDPTMVRFYSLDIPVGEYRDVFFVSPVGRLVSYTALVKAGN
jgi:hypothetical protein